MTDATDRTRTGRIAASAQTDAAESKRDVVVAGRYELRELLGRGGASRVYAALDAVTGARVAVKLIEGAPTKSSVRFRREVSALRLLRLPGVVSLLDEGVHEDSRFLVMDVVSGRPFPGVSTPIPWELLAPPTLALLEILARVHAAGVVHRDLKPSNVFVAADGRVTVLDFGISWGPALGEAVTTAGTIVGTPAYLAPEQFFAPGGDVRTDLYAVGVILYEALAARPPHDATEFAELVRLRRSKLPTPLRIAAPDVPRAVAAVVDQLLAMDPDDRPQSAGDALRALFGDVPLATTARALPRLGGDELVERLLAAALAGRSTDVSGPRGSGRTRLLLDATDRLRALGREVHWIVPGAAPYSSLAGLLGGLDRLSHAGHDAALREIRASIETRLRSGVVVVVDDAERVDRWSAATLNDCRGAGAVVRTSASASSTGDLAIGPLSEADLRPLFAGPDRIFHVREDGARELWRRTGGSPARIAVEVAAWVRAGVAHWADGRVVVLPDALQRLRGGQSVGDELLLRPGSEGTGSAHLDELLAWVALAFPHASIDVLATAMERPRWSIEPGLDALLELGVIRRLPDGGVQPLSAPSALNAWPGERRRAAHRALSSALAPGTPLRLRHLASGGAPEEVADEALLVAPELTKQGRSRDALVVLEEGLSAARHVGDADRCGRILVEFAKTCLAEGTPHALSRALYEIGRAGVGEPLLAQVDQLLRAARAAATGDGERALELLRDTGSFEDVELELWRQGQRMRAARALPFDREVAVLLEIEAWAQKTRHPRALASVAAWRALHLQKRRRFAEAAESHLAAARQSDRMVARMASQLNAGLCLCMIGRLAEARTAAETLRTLAVECRNPVYESHGEYLTRAIAYRSGELDRPDVELIDAVERLDVPAILRPLLVNEAAAAWRAGRLREGRDLAARGSKSWESTTRTAWRLVTRSLELVCGDAPCVGEVQSLATAAGDCVDADVAVQALGLLALAAPASAAELRALAARRAAELGPVDVDLRGEVLSVREALDGLDEDSAALSWNPGAPPA